MVKHGRADSSEVRLSRKKFRLAAEEKPPVVGSSLATQQFGGLVLSYVLLFAFVLMISR